MKTAIQTFMILLFSLGLFHGCGNEPGDSSQNEPPQPVVLFPHEAGVVVDLGQDLLWAEQVSPDPMTWREAAAYCQKLRLAGLEDWRLPTVKELEELYEALAPLADGRDRRVAPFVFGEAEAVWASDRLQSYTSIYHFVYFTAEFVFFADRFKKIHVLPVREHIPAAFKETVTENPSKGLQHD